MADNDTDQTPAENKKTTTTTEPSPRRNIGPQLIGALIGGFIAWAIAGAGNNLGWFAVNTTTTALWGGVIGGLIGANDALATAGKRLTNKDNKLLNTVVALVGMAVIFGIILGLAVLFDKLVDSLGWFENF